MKEKIDIAKQGLIDTGNIINEMGSVLSAAEKGYTSTVNFRKMLGDIVEKLQFVYDTLNKAETNEVEAENVEIKE